MSVNGWFRIDPNSWHATGIPVGHPDRYKSRGVIRTTKDTAVPYEHQELGVPLRGKTVETDADKELKKLLKRQLDTSVDLSYVTGYNSFSNYKIVTATRVDSHPPITQRVSSTILQVSKH
jgi:hypothetical protein